MRPTGGHPIVVGKSEAQANGKSPRVLFYGHYDVQPVDPLGLWETPPFAPRIATLPDGRKIIVARGACDDKGQVMTFVEACRAFKAVTGSLPLPITMVIEGEEECGSEHLFGFVKDNADELKLDLALVCDTSMWDEKTPMVTTSLRGLVYEEVKVTCADRDLHSGLFGGAAQNPLRVLARILAAMHDKNGRVAIPGFYNGVKELPADIKADLEAAEAHAEGLSRRRRPQGAGGRKEPHADRADRHPSDRRDQRPDRRLHRGGGEDRDPRPGHREGLVPPGRRPGSEQDPRCLPRLRARAAAGRRQGRVCELCLRAARFSCRTTIRRSARRAPRSPPNGARRR